MTCEKRTLFCHKLYFVSFDITYEGAAVVPRLLEEIRQPKRRHDLHGQLVLKARSSPRLEQLTRAVEGHLGRTVGEGAVADQETTPVHASVALKNRQ